MSTACARYKNIELFAVDGTSDDLDYPIREIFKDYSFCSTNNVCSLNSINIARIIVQVIPFYYAYLQVTSAGSKEDVCFVCPTGAAGNIAAATLARYMGLPIKLCAAVNENDVIYKLVSTGRMTISKDSVATNSPAMDIQVPYNVERVLYIISGGRSDLVKNWMTSFYDLSVLQLDENWQKKLRDNLSSFTVTSSQVAATIKHVWDTKRYLLCPHTGVGMHAATTMPSLQAHSKLIVVATAHPAKFQAAIETAIGRDAAVWALHRESQSSVNVSRVDSLKSLPKSEIVLPRTEDWIKQWETSVRNHIQGRYGRILQ
jgi:threonine synthase